MVKSLSSCGLFFLALSQVLQSKYPSLLAATDHLLDIYIELTGEKHCCPSVAYDKAPQEVSEAERENRRVVLEGRELSLRYSLCWKVPS